MPGFGYGPFGEGPFGQSDWGRAVFWKTVPEMDKVEDSDQLLENLLLAAGRTFNTLRDLAERLPELTDPLAVRTRHNERVSITITDYEVTESADTDDGRPYITMTASAGTWENLEPVAPGWRMETTERVYIVRSLHKISRQFTVWGDDPPPESSFTIGPPSLIENLGADMGLEIDGYEPEGFQRNLVSESIQWYNLKGTVDGVRLRAALAGFTAEVLPLYAVDVGWTPMLPAADVFEIPSGSGSYYTSYAPRFPLFDDVAADAIPLDEHCDLNVETTWPVVVSAVAGDSAAWELTTASDLTMIGSVGRWILTDADDQVFYLEAFETGMITVAGEIEPATGTYTLSYECPEAIDCGWCRSYKIMLELSIDPDSEIADDPDALDGVFDRLVDKIQAVLPAHVEVVQYTFVTTDEVTVYLEADGDSTTF